ncbi:DUF4870 domain-containing protein [Luteipulveratus flavus]|uniref:DUF4870 domain-containing protein n=1 Tax=Luteipulveratus flavus TaxID=3031728 RepID=A0ABT6C3D3_9MICO|nr:DUF4870 domain-containing protein [Luteipulveratus sp. YIM 133296]MDF8263360.1 DUF4870 domain-containing protein [Luteipulveratus sp. YIM 133296]
MSYPTQPYAGQPALSSQDRTASVLAHLSAPIAAVLSLGWLSMVGPLIVWFVYKDRSPAARHAAAGAFNFNLSFWILYLISWILIFSVIGLIVGVPLLIVIFVVAAWCHVKGAIRAANGQPYEYPWQLRVLR